MVILFKKILSVIMTAFFFFAGLIPGSKLNEPRTIDDISVFDTNMISFLDDADNAVRIFSSFDEWNDYSGKALEPEIKEYVDSVSESLFDEHNLVALEFVVANSSWITKITKAIENKNVLELEYVNVKKPDLFALEALFYSTVFVTVSKYITEVETAKLESIELPFILESSVENSFCIVEANPGGKHPEEFEIKSYIFSNYISWKSFLDSGEWEFSGYADTVDERYFESNNLALVISPLADSSMSLRIGYLVEQDGTLKISCYTVNESGISLAVEGFDVAFIETCKDIENIELTDGGDFDIPFMLDGSVPMVMW